jgi:hypothetical protein
MVVMGTPATGNRPANHYNRWMMSRVNSFTFADGSSANGRSERKSRARARVVHDTPRNIRNAKDQALGAFKFARHSKIAPLTRRATEGRNECSRNADRVD